MHECTYCCGRGFYGPVHAHTGESEGMWIERMKCIDCKGMGEWDDAHMARHIEGQKHRRERLARGENLYDCAIRLRVTPAQLAAFERGRAALPSPEAK